MLYCRTIQLREIEQFQPLILRPTFTLFLVFFVLLLNPRINFFPTQAPLFFVRHIIPSVVGFDLLYHTNSKEKRADFSICFQQMR